MKASLLVLMLLVGGALGLSYLSMPGEKELAVMEFREKNYESARTRFEDQWRAGDRSPAVAWPLAQSYMEEGAVEKAISVLETMVARQKDNPRAWHLLADLYGETHRPNDLIRALTAEAALAPSQETLRRLAERAYLAGDSAAEESALEALHAHGWSRPADLERLGDMLAGQGRLAEAVEVLRKRNDSFALDMEPRGRALLFSLLIDLGRAPEAASLAADWLSAQATAGELARFAGALLQHDKPKLALGLLEPYAHLADRSPAVQQQLVDAQVATGAPATALALMEGWVGKGVLAPGLVPQLVDLALQNDRKELADRALAGVDLGTLPGWLLSGLIQRALAGDDRETLRRLYARLGPDALADHPGLRGMLSLAVGDRAAAEHWADRAVADAASLDLDERLETGRLLVRLDRKRAAMDWLAGIAERPDAPPDVLSGLAQLYIDLHETRAGLALFDRLRRTGGSPAAAQGWALMAAAAGEGAALKAWIEETGPTDQAFLRDLYYLSEESGAREAALAAAERLAPGPETDLILARAYLADGRAAEAVPLLRRRLPGTEEIRTLYMDALAQAGEREALVAYLAEQLETPDLPPARTEELVYRLLDLGADGAALPTLRRLAGTGDSGWLYAYADAARRAGKTEGLVRFLEDGLAQTDLSPDARAARIGLLTEVAGDAAALPWLRRLAESDAGLEWLYAYADAARRAGREDELAQLIERQLDQGGLGPQAREARISLLVEAAGPAKALPYLRSQALAEGGSWLFAYQDALTKLGRAGELVDVLEARAGRDDLPAEERRQIAFQLLEAGRKGAAEAQFRRLAAAAGPFGPDTTQLLYLWGPRPDDAALDWLAARARQARGAARAGWLDHLSTHGGADRVIALVDSAGDAIGADDSLLTPYALALAALGDSGRLEPVLRRAVLRETRPEMLRRLAEAAEAARLPEIAASGWERLAERSPKDVAARRRLADTLVQQGRFGDAVTAYRNLLKLRPKDSDLYYRYGEALFGQGRIGDGRAAFRKALDGLEARAHPSFEDRRLMASILGRLGHVRAARNLYDDLLEERPRDRDLRADYATLLLDNGLMQQARRVLALN